ncbi:NACHT, LRR and PYD domains-containing protein 1 homolog [Anoplopoma fimbria]|uniref:NACHT, LRR and PYD domains-containing protein 1 homolog n=1 Tax=Anoplopoma fimbria TaxID=229290 RepID=UPI0023EAF2F4|nr:NACHT, LRR and PYD domains-containing protein 1 homolog [Anoplopoma fimbria]
MTTVQEKLLETLKDLTFSDFEQFKLLLRSTTIKKGLPIISKRRLERADKVGIVKLMMKTYDQQCVDLTRMILMKMDRRYLLQGLSDTSSVSKRPSKSLEPVSCGSNVEDSSDWTKLEPEVDSTGADEAPIYSLQSEAGSFECNVSGFRWICKEKVSFKYQFCSLEEHMERIKSMQYMPAGPLMDITVLAGRFFEGYLPHWICIVDNPTILDKFAVLHTDDCGDVVEKVSEVTSSHVKLSEPVFSLKMVLLRIGLPIKVNCNVSIFVNKTSFLTLHVYLTPRDPGLQQKLEKIELPDGYKVIRKPHPAKSLKMNDWFILSTDLDGAEICPKKLMLRYESTEPNFIEVFINNPDTNFHLNLTKENECEPVWTRAIRKDEYQSTVHIQETPGPSNADNAAISTLQSRVSSIHTTDSCLQSLENAGASTTSSGTIATTQDSMRSLSLFAL